MIWNIYGHDWAAEMLQKHASNNGVRHAYLFCGPAGVGRRTLALHFARVLNCLEPPQPGEACGQCRACKLIERMQHPDLAVVQADQEGGKLRVEQVRDLQHTLSLAPYEARYRVALLLRFQEANANAQNALLKTLEEPPRRVILLLTADSPEELLPTIVSRCEVLRLRPMPVAQLQTALQQNWGVEENEARRLAHLCGGRVGSALRFRDNPQELEQRLRWMGDLIELLAAPQRRRFAYADQVRKNEEKNRGSARRILLAWLSLWRDVFLMTANEELLLANLDQEGEIRRLAGKLDFQNARRALDGFQNALEMLENNVNLLLLFENLFLDLPRI